MLARHLPPTANASIHIATSPYSVVSTSGIGNAVTGGPALYEGETIYSWNVATKEITYVYWNSIGGVSTGTATVLDDGSIAFPDESYTGTRGEKIVLSTHWQNIGLDDFNAVTRTTYESGRIRGATHTLRADSLPRRSCRRRRRWQIPSNPVISRRQALWQKPLPIESVSEISVPARV